MKIRRDDCCAACGIELPAGTTAYWIRTERIVRCVLCHSAGVEDQVPGVQSGPSGGSTHQPVPSPVGGVAWGDVAGESAQREYDKRAARERAKNERGIAEDAEWRDSVRQQRPVLGRLATALTPKPQITPESQATKAWKVGAEGERRVAEVLEEADGVEVLHDRLIPGRRANIDHIAIGPSGVFVIDAKKYTGRIEVRDVGWLLRPDERRHGAVAHSLAQTRLGDGQLVGSGHLDRRSIA